MSSKRPALLRADEYILKRLKPDDENIYTFTLQSPSTLEASSQSMILVHDRGTTHAVKRPVSGIRAKIYRPWLWYQTKSASLLKVSYYDPTGVHHSVHRKMPQNIASQSRYIARVRSSAPGCTIDFSYAGNPHATLEVFNLNSWSRFHVRNK